MEAIGLDLEPACEDAPLELCDGCRPFYEENGFLDPNQACRGCLRSVETLSKLTTVHETVAESLATGPTAGSSSSESGDSEGCCDVAFGCAYCGLTFATNASLQKHEFAHLRGYSSPEDQETVDGLPIEEPQPQKGRRARKGAGHSCPVCLKRFARATDVKRHYVTHTGERPFVCQLCSMAFKDPSNLRKHANTHKSNSSEFKTYQCRVCAKLFSRPSELKRHFFTHTNTRPFSCHVCGLAFSDSSNLKKHVYKHSKQSEHSCYDCGLRCNLFEELEQHLREFHNDNNNGSSAEAEALSGIRQQHVCCVCYKTFSSEGFLRAHCLSHTESRPHHCQVCQKAFKSLAHLKNHSLTHQGGKEHSCSLCGKAFLKKSSLKRHMSIHTKHEGLISFS